MHSEQPEPTPSPRAVVRSSGSKHHTRNGTVHQEGRRQKRSWPLEIDLHLAHALSSYKLRQMFFLLSSLKNALVL